MSNYLNSLFAMLKTQGLCFNQFSAAWSKVFLKTALYAGIRALINTHPSFTILNSPFTIHH